MNLLDSQMVEMKNGKQVHEYWLTPLLHVPPFLHGLLRHSFISRTRKITIIKPTSFPLICGEAVGH